MTRWFFLPFLALMAGIAVAADNGDGTGERVLGEDEIRAFTAGKTFHYTLRGESRGAEQHFLDGRVTWRLPEGTCMHGVWIARQETLCYYYGALRYGCWNVVKSADGYRHSPLEMDGSAGFGSPVHIDRISEEPVGCAPQQLASYSLP